MTNLKKLFNTLYKKAFLDNPASLEAANELMAMVKTMITGNIFNKKQMDIFKEGAGLAFKNASPEEAAHLNPQDYRGMMDAIFDAPEILEPGNVPEEFTNVYKPLAVREHVIAENGDLLAGDPVVAPPQEQPMVIEEFKQRMLGMMAARSNNPVENDDFIMHFEGERIVSSVMNEFIGNLAGNDVIALIRSVIPAYPDENSQKKATSYLQNFMEKTFRFTEIINNHPAKDFEALENELHDMEFTSPSEVIDKVSELANNLPAPRRDLFITKLKKSIQGAVTNIYSSLPNSEAVMLDKLCSIENAVAFLPKRSSFDTYLTNPNVGVSHPYEGRINALKSVYPDAEADLDFANQILISTSEAVTHSTSEAFEGIGRKYERAGDAEGFNYVNEAHPGQNVFERPDGKTFVKKNAPDDEKINIVRQALKNNSSFTPAEQSRLVLVLSDAADRNIFLTDGYVPEEPNKLYGLRKLAAIKEELKNAVKAGNDIQLIHAKTAEYRNLSRQIDEVIANTKVKNPGEISQNVSAARNGSVDPKYRTDYVGTSRLAGVYHAVNFCQNNHIDFESFVKNPLASAVKAAKEASDSFYLNNVFKNHKNDRAALFRILSSDETKARLQTEVQNIHGKITGVSRSLWGLESMVGSENKKDLIRDGLIVGDIIGNTGNTYNALQSGFFTDEFALANLFFLKEEDFNPLRVAKGSTESNLLNLENLKLKNNPQEGYDYDTLNFYPKIDTLDYIKKNYTPLEIIKKCKEMYDAAGKSENMWINQGITFLKEGFIHDPHFTDREKTMIENALTGKTNSRMNAVLDSVKPLQIRQGVNANITQLYNEICRVYTSYPQLSRKGAVNIQQNYLDKMDDAMNENRMNFHVEALGKKFTECGINLEELRLDPLAALRLAATGDERFKNFKIDHKYVQEFFENSRECNINRINVPEEWKKQSPDRAQNIQNAFIGTSGKLTTPFQSLESMFVRSSDALSSVNPTKKFLAEHQDYQGAFVINGAAMYYPYHKNAHMDQAVERMKQFQVSEVTKNAILKVYDKMNQYGMLIDFPTTGEEPHKVYGFHKYLNARNEVEKEIALGHIKEAEENAGKFAEVKKQYDDVLNLCEATFPQDGKHFTGNVNSSRETFIPIEFTQRLQAQVQMHAVYQIASMCKHYGLDIREALEHPETALTLAFRQEAKEMTSFYMQKEDDPEGQFLFNIATEVRRPSNLILARGFDAICSLELDPARREANGTLNVQISDYFSTLREAYYPFIIADGNPKDIPSDEEKCDLDNLRNFIATGGQYPITTFLPHQYDLTTGKKYDMVFSLENFISTDTRSLNDVLSDVKNSLAGFARLLKTNVNAFPKAVPSIAHCYTAATMYIKEVLRIRGLENEDSIAVNMAKAFLNNPAGEMNDYLAKKYPDKRYQTVSPDEVATVREDKGYDSIPDNHYFTEMQNLSINEWESQYNSMIEESGAVTPENISKMLVLARLSNQSYQARGRMNLLFRKDGNREWALFEKIRDGAYALGLTEPDLVNMMTADPENILKYNLAHTEAIARRHVADAELDSIADKISHKAIKDELAGLFAKGSLDDLTEDQKEAYRNPDLKSWDEDYQLKVQAMTIMAGHPLNSDNLSRCIIMLKDMASLEKNIPENGSYKGVTLDKLNMERNQIYYALMDRNLSKDEIDDLANDHQGVDITIQNLSDTASMASLMKVLDEKLSSPHLTEFSLTQEQPLLKDILSEYHERLSDPLKARFLSQKLRIREQIEKLDKKLIDDDAYMIMRNDKGEPTEDCIAIQGLMDQLFDMDIMNEKDNHLDAPKMLEDDSLDDEHIINTNTKRVNVIINPSELEDRQPSSKAPEDLDTSVQGVAGDFSEEYDEPKQESVPDDKPEYIS